MENKKEIEPVVEEQTPEEKDLISSDDVLAVVSGNQLALIEQLERAKQVALEQLEAGRDSGPINQKQLEAELKRREADLEAAKRVQAEMKRKEELARQEAERKKREAEEAARQQKLAAEAELRRQAEEARQRQLQLEEEERKKREEEERLKQEKIAREQEIARKKQEKEAAILRAKLEKEQKRLARLEEIKQKKLAKEEEKRKRKEAREEERRQRQLAKEEAKKQSQKEKVESLETTNSNSNSSSQSVGGVASSISQPQSVKRESTGEVEKIAVPKEKMPQKKLFQKKVVEPQPVVEKKSKVEGVKKMEEEKLKKDSSPVVVPPVDNQQNKGVQPVGVVPNTVSKPERPAQTPTNIVAPIPVNNTSAVISTGAQATPNMTVVAPNTSATSVNAVPISNSVDNKTATTPTTSVATSNSKVETLDTSANLKASITNNNTNTTGVDDNGKKEGPPEGKKNNFKYWMTLILFICLLLLVVFLPQISEMVSRYKEEKQRAQDAVITTGDLKCKLTKSDDKYDYEYKATFAFRDSKMHRLNYTAITKGDRNEDALELTEMKKTCDILKEQTGTMEGIDVVCTLVNGVYTNEQILKYDVLNTTKVTTAYLEAGGTYPNYTYQQDIGEIEKQMKASGYTCERER